jgi:hypothetical protein
MGKHGYDNIQANERILEKIIKEIVESKSKGKATGKVTGKITKPHLYDFARVICGIGGGRMRVKMCENRAEIEVLIRGTLCGTKRSPVRLHKGSPVIIYDHKEIFAIIPETTPGDRIAIRALIADEIYPKCLLIPVDDDEDELDDSAGEFGKTFVIKSLGFFTCPNLECPSWTGIPIIKEREINKKPNKIFINTPADKTKA